MTSQYCFNVSDTSILLPKNNRQLFCSYQWSQKPCNKQHSIILQNIVRFFIFSMISNTHPHRENMGAQRNSPKATVNSPGGKSTTLQFLFNLDSHGGISHKEDKKIQSLDSRNEELQLIIFYCTELRSDDQESALKRLKLTQLLSIIKTSITPISDETKYILYKMVASNLFRCLPRPSSSTVSVISPEDDDVVATPSAAWAHLQIVYDILLQLIIKKDVNSIRREHSDGSRIFNEGT